jgi:non-heme chloroperoxidase
VLSAFSRLQDPIPYPFARDFQASTIYHPVPAQFFELWVAEAQRVPASTWHGLGQGHREPVEELKKIRIPTLVVWGEKDSIFSRADQELLVSTLPKATFSAYPETGHALHWERPERFRGSCWRLCREGRWAVVRVRKPPVRSAGRRF